MNFIWRGILLVVLVLLSGVAATGHTDCMCGTCLPGPCDIGCDLRCDAGCENKFIYKDACSSLEATDDGYLWTIGRGRCAQTFRFDGWIETGILANSHGATRNAGGEYAYVDATADLKCIIELLENY